MATSKATKGRTNSVKEDVAETTSKIITPNYDFQHPSGRPLETGTYVPKLADSSELTLVGAVLILNKSGQILVGMNRKRHVWDIPQGVVEKDETPQQAAVRELFEETNLLFKDTDLEQIGVFRHKTEEFVYPWETHLFIAHNGGIDVASARNMEQEKCDRIAWFAPIQMPHPRGLSLRMSLSLLGH